MFCLVGAPFKSSQAGAELSEIWLFQSSKYNKHMILPSLLLYSPPT